MLGGLLKKKTPKPAPPAWQTAERPRLVRDAAGVPEPPALTDDPAYARVVAGLQNVGARQADVDARLAELADRETARQTAVDADHAGDLAKQVADATKDAAERDQLERERGVLVKALADLTAKSEVAKRAAALRLGREYRAGLHPLVADAAAKMTAARDALEKLFLAVDAGEQAELLVPVLGVRRGITVELFQAALDLRAGAATDADTLCRRVRENADEERQRREAAAAAGVSR
jgi:hypothetical protein